MARLAFPLLVAVGLLAVLHAPQTCFPGQGLWRRLRGKVEQPRHLSVRAAAENPLKAVGLSNGVVAEVSEKDKFQAEVSRGTQESTNLRPFEQTIAAEAVADIVEAQPPAAKKTPVEKQPEAEKAQAVAPVLQPPPAPKKSEAARAVDAVPAPAPRSESSVPKEPSSGLFDFARLAESARASESEAAKLDWGFLQKSLWSTTAEAFEYAAKDGQGGSLLFGGVALATFVALGLGLSALQPAGAPVRSPPAPVVVTVQQTAPAPKAIEPVAPAPVSPAPIAPAAVAPKSATPAAPATAKPVQPITSIKSPAPVASPVSQTEVRSTASAPVTSPVSGPVELPWARTLAEVTAGGLKQLSDGLPAAERQLEANVPTIIKTAEWTSTVNPDNIQSKVQEALPVVGGVVAKGTEVVTRAGLEVGSVGLKTVGDSLPGVGQALQRSVEAAMPSFQSGAHATADLARDAAKQAATLQPEMLPANIPVDVRKAAAQLAQASPNAFKFAAAATDFIADAAPGVEQAVAYAAGKAMPAVQAFLGSASEVSQDAARIPADKLPALPEVGQVAASLQAVGVDTDQLSSGAQELARQVQAKVQAAAPKAP